ncbi:MAG: hypothetical protein WCJ33_00210 [Pseudomonadota bacterium]
MEGGFTSNPEKSYIDTDWEGGDENDAAFGNIYAYYEEGELRGEIGFHNGDESEFRAVPF